MRLSISFLLIVLLFSSCNQEKQNIDIKPSDYHALIDRVTGIMVHDIFSPPVASRVYVYPNIAAYQVLNETNGKNKSLANQLNGLQPLNKETPDSLVNKKLSAIIAYLDVAKDLVFSKEMITSYRDSLYNIWSQQNPEQFENSKNYALAVSEHIHNWMNQDKYKETRTMPEFTVHSEDPSRWQPTPPAYMKGIEPNWMKIRTFVLDSASQFKPIPPPPFSLEKGSAFYKELIDVYNIGNEIVKKGDESEEVKIAQFWDCNPYVAVNKGHFMFASKKITPGAHWMGICKIANIKAKADFDKTVHAYTKTSIALADAFISCWDEKYRSNLIRPETLINKYIDEDWTPLLQTPPFPEYTSGHSVVSGAAAEALTSIFGDNFAFDDTTEIPYGLPVRSYKSFREAAREAAISRVYGGIHYNAAVYEGIDQGISVGKLVNTKISF
ncbi:MAG: phosphatidic acid phosphatase [Flavobacteriaceae bacterium]|nr:phosphatidic acid phosphatase [Flavobacteriaceae bacterium]|tara:strand:- start:393367 stop:394686 length:1320 start_codon:yes stop_codon:yes gene_type:complete